MSLKQVICDDINYKYKEIININLKHKERMSSLKEINGRYYSPANVVMLPTEKASHLYILNKELKFGFYNQKSKPEWTDLINQHLYITSDEEIKEGDWYYNNHYNSVALCTSIHALNRNNQFKIIATTDTSLELPQLSQSFIKTYIEAYNNGKVIDKVMVEYTKFENIRWSDEWQKFTNNEEILKVDRNNEITIKPIKDSLG